MFPYIITICLSLQAFAMHGELTKIDKKTYNVEFDIKYATTENFTNTILYKVPEVYLHRDTAKSLKIAARLANQLGYKIKIFDGFRPTDVQKQMWSVAPKEGYVSNPVTGACGHCRGVAIDLTLIDSNGKELDMGTEFDDLTVKSNPTYKDVTVTQLHNRALLAGIMSIAGFEGIETEWWHFQLKEWRKYKKFSEQEAGIKLKNG